MRHYVTRMFDFSRNDGGNIGRYFWYPTNAYINFSDRRPVNLRSINIQAIPFTLGTNSSGNYQSIQNDWTFEVLSGNQAEHINEGFEYDLNETFGVFDMTEVQNSSIYLPVGNMARNSEIAQWRNLSFEGSS